MRALLRPTDVLAAADRIRPLVRRTPLVLSAALSEIAGGSVYFKRENEQLTGSFKLRGALNVLATLAPHVRARGVVASSAGNHGLGVAYAARHFNVPATIFVPSTASRVKIDGIVAMGASIDTSQPHYDAAMEEAVVFAANHNSTFINPCTGDMLLAGQGTVAQEILADLPDLATLIGGVGGGGLLGGCASLLRPVAPKARIIGAQGANTAAMARSLAAGRIIEIENLATLADGLAGQIDDYALDLGRRALDDVVTLSEAEIAETIRWLWHDHGQRVEGAGACGVGALLLHKLESIATPAVIIVSGGNIDGVKFDAIIGAREATSMDAQSSAVHAQRVSAEFALPATAG